MEREGVVNNRTEAIETTDTSTKERVKTAFEDERVLYNLDSGRKVKNVPIENYMKPVWTHKLNMSI